MGEHKSCSRDECPAANISAESTTNCGNCDRVVHLMCIGINRKVKDVLFHQNIKIMCNKCVHGESKSSKPKSTSTSTTIPANKSTSNVAPKSSHRLQQSPIWQYASNDKIDEMFAVLQSVEKTVTNTNAIVASQFESSKSYSDILKEIKEVSVSTEHKCKSDEVKSRIVCCRR